MLFPTSSRHMLWAFASTFILGAGAAILGAGELERGAADSTSKPGGTAIERASVRGSQAASSPAQRLLAEICRQPGSPTRERLIGALLLHIAEQDLDRALELAEKTPLGPQMAFSVALGFLERSGFSHSSVRRVATSLPGLADASLEPILYEAWAFQAPEDAFRAATRRFPAATRPGVQRRIAEMWAARSPLSAQTAAHRHRHTEARVHLLRGILVELAAQDLEAMLRLASKVSSSDRRIQHTLLTELELRDPRIYLDTWLAMIPPLPSLSTLLVSAAAQRAPRMVIERIESIPVERIRKKLQVVAALGFGRTDPEGAWNWALSLQQPHERLLTAVIAGISKTKPDYAISLTFEKLFEELDRRGIDASEWQVRSAIGALAAIPGADLADLMRRVRELPDDRRLNAQYQLHSIWMSRDPAGAATWVRAVAEDLATEELTQLVSTWATDDVKRAAEFAGQLEPATHGPLLERMAELYATSDPDAALAWLDQLADQPGHERRIARAIYSLAADDPVAAARLIPESPNATLELPGQLSIPPDRDSRLEIIERIASELASREPNTARTWATTLENGPERDAAVHRLLRARRTESLPDPELLELLSSDTEREREMVFSISEIARSDLPRALRLLDEHIRPGEQRDRMRRELSQNPPYLLQVQPLVVQ